jgi:hypothetical protein
MKPLGDNGFHQAHQDDDRAHHFFSWWSALPAWKT